MENISDIVKVGDKYNDGRMTWICTKISNGFVTFCQDIIVNYHWSVPSSDRHIPYHILTFEQTKQRLQCPVYNWTKTEEPTRTINY